MKKSRRFPAEPSSRRPGWNEGEPVRLADGELWYLPVVGDGIIPSLPALMPMADALNDEYFLALYAGLPTPPGFGRLALAFIRAVLATQYDLPAATLRDLVDGFDEADGTAMVGAIDRLLHELAVYATQRYSYVAASGYRSWQSAN